MSRSLFELLKARAAADRLTPEEQAQLAEHDRLEAKLLFLAMGQDGQQPTLEEIRHYYPTSRELEDYENQIRDHLETWPIEKLRATVCRLLYLLRASEQLRDARRER